MLFDIPQWVTAPAVIILFCGTDSGPPIDYQVRENNCDYFENQMIMQSILNTRLQVPVFLYLTTSKVKKYDYVGILFFI